MSGSELQRHQWYRFAQLIAQIHDRSVVRLRIPDCPPIDPDAADAVASAEKVFHQFTPIQKSELMAMAGEGSRDWFDLPAEQYVRLHQTSGTTGPPLIVRDTAADWQWWLDCWDHVLDAAKITARDTAMMAFSFGPFIGFWTAADAMIRRGVTTVPGGGLSTGKRLQMIVDLRCTVVCCTPTYAMRMIAVAEQTGIDLADSDVRVVVVAGEPGGSLPPVRRAISTGFNAAVIDHAGGSEIGAWAYGRPDGTGLHVIESEFIAEILRFEDPDGRSIADGRPVAVGETGELVLTNLGRFGGPAIRYRTGDVVRRGETQTDDPFLFLPGGVIGRVDDMVVVRGVNIFPSAVETLVRQLEPTAEYCVDVSRPAEMDRLSVRIETSPDRAASLSRHLSDSLALTIPVSAIPVGTLPVNDAKSRRFRFET